MTPVLPALPSVLSSLPLPLQELTNQQLPQKERRGIKLRRKKNHPTLATLMAMALSMPSLSHLRRQHLHDTGQEQRATPRAVYGEYGHNHTGGVCPLDLSERELIVYNRQRIRR